MMNGFDKWWSETGHRLDPDTEDVPWFDKRAGLAQAAFDAGVAAGMARAGNYVADDPTSPTVFRFTNGTTVKIIGGRLVQAPDIRGVDSMTWQPIDTAPDATYVLVWVPGYGINVATQTKHQTGDHWWRRDHADYCRPTHWMRLPSPPESERP